MDLVTVFAPCATACGFSQCDECAGYAAYKTLNRLTFARWLYEHGRISDGEPQTLEEIEAERVVRELAEQAREGGR